MPFADYAIDSCLHLTIPRVIEGTNRVYGHAQSKKIPRHLNTLIAGIMRRCKASWRADLFPVRQVSAGTR